MKNTYTSRELADEIIEQATNAGLEPGDYAPAGEVQKWLDATDNEGDAEEISRVIYDRLEDEGAVIVTGRPPMFGQRMRQTAVWLPEEMIDWLKNQDGTMSEVMRALISEAMDK